MPTQTNVLVSLVQPSNRAPTDPAAERTGIIDRWKEVEKYYSQASFGEMDIRTKVTEDWHELTGDLNDYILLTKDDPLTPETEDLSWPPNVRPGGPTNRLVAEAAKAAVDENLSLSDYDALAVVIYLNDFIRARNVGTKQKFTYSGNGVTVNETVGEGINVFVIHEGANWGRHAHELAHKFVSAPRDVSPFETAESNAMVQREDIYTSDLIDKSVASAARFDMMGSHNLHPLFSGYYMRQLGWYEQKWNDTGYLDDQPEIKYVEWDRNETTLEYNIVAHGNSKNTDPDRCHIVWLKISDGLHYLIEVRQRPGTTNQVFDRNIPVSGGSTSSGDEGGVIVTAVLTDVVNNNQQMRFLSLLHDRPVTTGGTVAVMKQGDSAIDPLRDLTITVLDDSVQARPLECKVEVSWAVDPDADPEGKFDLFIEPWDRSVWQTPDIWVDRDQDGQFDNEKDAQGRPKGTGDKPKPLSENDIIARIHNDGVETAKDVRASIYAVYPPGIGDNDNWGPKETISIGDIDPGDTKDISTMWVPTIGSHTCLKVAIAEQFGETSFGNNLAQENIFEFEAVSQSVPQPVTVTTAVRNPIAERRVVNIEIENVPSGYLVHYPHQWVWLNPHEEREFEMTIVPTEDYEWYLDAHREELTASINIQGSIMRDYTEEIPPSTVPPSVPLPIGGITVNVRPKRKVELHLEAEHIDPGSTVLVGRTVPRMVDERIRIEITAPTGEGLTLQEMTDEEGEFKAEFDPTAIDEEEFTEGVYKAQAGTFNSPNAAERLSNILYFPLPGSLDDVQIEPPTDSL